MADHYLIKQPDGRSVLVIDKNDAVDIYVSDGAGAQVIGLDIEFAWKLGRVLVWHWLRSWCGLKLWLWRRHNQPRLGDGSAP